MATTEPDWRDQIAGMTAHLDSGFGLSLEQRFDVARMNRIIEEISDVQELRELAKQLLEAWQTQRAATNWVISQQTGWKPSGLQNHPADR